MKTSTRVILLIILTQFAMCGTWMCMVLASMWIEVGHGLHPYISLPLAGILCLIPYIVHSLWFESNDDEDRHDTSTINVRHPAEYARRERIDSGSTDFPKDVF